MKSQEKVKNKFGFDQHISAQDISIFNEVFGSLESWMDPASPQDEALLVFYNNVQIDSTHSA
ncbi:MAG: hypothetical protein ISS33_06050 [Candidatus Omnitrophica bacterium]|nr:hypothetical protein [Candidatus Omnitrophota bacterium]